jgi:hypothetical protein
MTKTGTTVIIMVVMVDGVIMMKCPSVGRVLSRE